MTNFLKGTTLLAEELNVAFEDLEPDTITLGLTEISYFPPSTKGLHIQQDVSYILPHSANNSSGIYYTNQLNCVFAGNPSGAQVWHNLDRGFMNTDSTASGDMVVRYVQAVRNFAAADTVMQPLVVQAADQTGQPSSVAGGMSLLELDMSANGADDATLPNRSRTAITLVASRALSGANAEFNYMFGCFAPNAYGFYKLMLMPPFRDVGIDFRNSSSWAGSGSGTDNAIWFRNGLKIALDTNGDWTLRYDSGSSRVKIAYQGTDKFSIDTSGNVRAAGTLTGSTTP